ncbi:MAG: DUF302 domain-containing protein [Rhodobacteraceae bacterium]|nr:DUF302 domain-containing protein [Paracoccaceae bacterium]
MSDLGQTIDVAESFDAAVERVTAALAAEGFGIVSRVDLDKAFRDKLGAEFRRYAILGACNPKMAKMAVEARPEVGLLLPCNIVVEERGDAARVRIVDAAAMLSVGDLNDSDAIRALSEDARARLGRVGAALAA